MFLVCLFATPLQAAVSAQGLNGLTVSVNSSGAYDILFAAPAWRFGGDIGSPLSNLTQAAGSDALGPYAEVTFDYALDAPRHAGIRVYSNRQAVLFSVQYLAAAANVAPFPTLSRYPSLPSHLTYAGYFAIHSFPGFGNEGPWIFFDSNATTFLLSPAANFLVARTTHGPSGEISTGISSQIQTLPAGFTHQTLLVVDGGVNRAFENWGNALTSLSGKTRPANDADPILNQLGYWTDAGAIYYYQTEPGMSYQDTLTAVKSDFDRQGIALGYLQLDSWFYPKGPLADWHDGAYGIYDYSAAQVLFGASLRTFQQDLGIPLITHARWIDPSSPVRQQYQMSGNVSIDPKYWNRVAQYLASAGGAAYEQDWMGDQAHTDFNLTDPYAFLDGMAAAMDRYGLNMQYCMATPGQFLQSTRYDNLTTVRTSEDRFDRPRWTKFLYTSRLASALGVWPFTDVFMSGETDNLLLATLSAGPVGIGDRIGALNRDNLLRAVRPDGVIVKPDVPIAPLDQSFINDSLGTGAPMIASTYTDFGGLQAAYVFAYSQGTDMVASFRPADLGFAGQVYIYNYFDDSGRLAEPNELASESMANGRAYYVVSPVGPSGIAVLGDRGQFITLGKKRIASLADDGAAHVTVVFARGETSRTIFGYSPSAPVATATAGGAGSVTYDPATARFSVDVTPGQDQTASLDLSGIIPGGAGAGSESVATALP